MKTATIQQVPQQWAQILNWIACDEEIEVVQDNKIIARIVPAHAAPDFVARAQAVWGSAPSGQPFGSIIHESRGAGV